MGPKRTPRLAARYADEFNLPFASVPDSAAQFDRVREACAEIGRDPAELCWSNALVLCCGRDDAEVARRAAAIGREPDELRANGLAGTPAEIVDTHRPVRGDRQPAALPAGAGPRPTSTTSSWSRPR